MAVATTPAPATYSVGVWTRRIFLANLVAQIAIVVTGGGVRLTGSGLGCPTWPECMPGSFTPIVHEANRIHAYIEFGNRLLTFVLGILAIAALVAGITDARKRSRRGAPTRRGLLLLSAVPLLGTLAQAVLGGITVLTGLHPATVAAHFMLSIVIIGLVVKLVHESRHEGPARLSVRHEIRWATRLLIAMSFAVLVVGTIVTGAGPHAGDANMVERFAVDPRVISWLHADLVLLYIGLALGTALALRVTNAPVQAQRAAVVLIATQLFQGAIGYVQYFTGLPIALVAVHMLGACLVWVATLRLHLATSTT